MLYRFLVYKDTDEKVNADCKQINDNVNEGSL